MPAPLAALARIRRKLDLIRDRSAPTAFFPQYRDDPLGFIRDVLGITLTPGQIAVVQALLLPPRRVLCSSGHSVGKSLLSACLVLWFFFSRSTGTAVTTAPTLHQVQSIVWKEVRRLAAEAKLPDCWAGPKAPCLETAPHHTAFGITAVSATAFQGQHNAGGQLFVFDEAEAIDADFFRAVRTMLDDESFLLVIYNPTGGSGTATHEAERQADEHGDYTRKTLSCLDHPNVLSQLAGGPLVIQGAITLTQLRSMLREDSLLLGPGDEPASGDVELSGSALPAPERYRPGPIAGARCLGRRPLIATAGVWNEELWSRVLAARFEIRPEWPVVIGCDVARYGDCSTVIVVRKGYCVLDAQVCSQQDTAVTARKIREACHRFADGHNPEHTIPCLIDEGGVGSGVIDQAGGYLFVPVNASKRPHEPKRYVNVRAELWFKSREAALQNCLDVSRLPVAILTRLRQELLACQYEIVEGTDRVRVSSKEDAVEQLKRSPDLADAFNLCCYTPALPGKRGVRA